MEAMKHFNTGLIFGKFYPLHFGHIFMIEKALEKVDHLYVFVCSETERDHQLFLKSKMIKEPTPKDRADWFLPLMQKQPNLHIISFNEDGIPSYPNGWEAWSDRAKDTLFQEKINPSIIFSSESQDKISYEKFFKIPVELIDVKRTNVSVSATKIRDNPDDYKHYIPNNVLPFFYE